jgi:hypothetical protein
MDIVQSENLPAVIKPKSPELSRLIEYLADPNLTMSDIDEKMMEEFPHLVKEGWAIGSTRKKVNKYPILARTKAEARALLWRTVGLSKVDGYKVIADAMSANTYSLDGTAYPDHKTRLSASDRMLTLMGENVNPAGAKTNVTISGADSKILIQTSDGSAVPFPMRNNNIIPGTEQVDDA